MISTNVHTNNLLSYKIYLLYMCQSAEVEIDKVQSWSDHKICERRQDNATIIYFSNTSY